MFERLTIGSPDGKSGFQRHRYRVIELGRVNTFIGETDAGKSTALRALFWLSFNLPSGDEFFSWGAKSCAVSLDFDGGRNVSRRKGPGENIYILDGRVYEQVGTSVPADVSRALNVCRDNYALQLDPHFWLLLSPPELSRELNRVVDLGLIDRVLNQAAATVRQAAAEEKVCRDRLEAAVAQKKALMWVNDLDYRLTELEVQQVALTATREKQRRIADLLADARRVALDWDRLATAALRCSKAVVAGRELLQARERATRLRELLDLAKRAYTTSASPIPDTTRLKASLAAYQAIRVKRERLAALLREAVQCHRAYETARESFWTNTQELHQLRASLPPSCPLCLSPIQKSSPSPAPTSTSGPRRR